MWKTVALGSYLAVLSVYDVRYRKVPVIWLIGGLVMAACYCGTVIAGDVFAGAAALSSIVRFSDAAEIQRTVIEMLKNWIPGLLMLLACRFTGKVGSGDGWVLLIIGSVLDEGEMGAVFAASLVFAAMTAVFLLVFRKVRKEDCLPYIPFLLAAVLLIRLGGK